MAKNNEGGNLAWFLAGLTVGVAAAILFAPKSGQETRQDIADAASKGRDLADRKRREVVEFGRDVYDQGRDLAEGAKEAGREVLDKGKQALSELGTQTDDGASPEAEPTSS